MANLTIGGLVGRPPLPPLKNDDPLIQLAVDYHNGQTRYYRVRGSWHINAADRCIVIGKGLPRTHIPLDSVAAFRVEQVPQ